jgi:hypothetical protein
MVEAIYARGYDGTAEMNKCITPADAIIILHEASTILGVRFSCLPDIEAEPQCISEMPDQHRWTCLREAVGSGAIPSKGVMYDPEADEKQGVPWKHLKTHPASK